MSLFGIDSFSFSLQFFLRYITTIVSSGGKNQMDLQRDRTFSKTRKITMAIKIYSNAFESSNYCNLSRPASSSPLPQFSPKRNHLISQDTFA